MKYLSKSIHFFLAATLSITLAGCGGGGGGGDTPAAGTGSTAEGVYVGTLGVNAGDFWMLVLENNEFWLLYDNAATPVVGGEGFVQGSGASGNGIFSSLEAKDFGSDPATEVTVNATYHANDKTISGSLAGAGITVDFSGGPNPRSRYDYNVPASLSEVEGLWTLLASTGELYSMIILEGGFAANSSPPGGCSFTGRLTPRPSGKNVFNMSLTFGAEPCPLHGQSVSGIAVVNLDATGGTAQRQLLLVGTNADRTAGALAIGRR